MRSSLSKTTTRWPARVSCWAAASPAGPDPTTATLQPVDATARWGTIQPSAHARSTISTSTCLMVTGGSWMPSTHAASHGAGHRRPVNSGKLLVACNRSMARRHWPRYTRSFQSGIRLPRGQPSLQNGIPQSMQRAACCCSLCGGKSSYTSRQSRSRTGTGRRAGNSRLWTRKPRGSAIAGRSQSWAAAITAIISSVPAERARAAASSTRL